MTPDTPLKKPFGTAGAPTPQQPTLSLVHTGSDHFRPFILPLVEHIQHITHIMDQHEDPYVAGTNGSMQRFNGALRACGYSHMGEPHNPNSTTPTLAQQEDLLWACRILMADINAFALRMEKNHPYIPAPRLKAAHQERVAFQTELSGFVHAKQRLGQHVEYLRTEQRLALVAA